MTSPSGQSPHDSDDAHQGSPSPDQGGKLATTKAEYLAAAGSIGLVVGWSIRSAALRLDLIEPDISWLLIGALVFFAAFLGVVAYDTRRRVVDPTSGIVAEQAVNRLVIAKSSALVGALLVGVFAGYAIAQLGLLDPAANGRFWRSSAAMAASTLVLLAALRLERACRVPQGDD